MIDWLFNWLIDYISFRETRPSLYRINPLIQSYFLKRDTLFLSFISYIFEKRSPTSRFPFSHLRNGRHLVRADNRKDKYTGRTRRHSDTGKRTCSPPRNTRLDLQTEETG